MRLKLVNFRCHTSLELSFPEKGFILLHGKNGTGKSTILESFYYVLYGVANPYTFGATTCSVELDIQDVKISRSSKPNRLLVTHQEKIYEDEEAQCIINSKFGNKHEFLASSYIRQSERSSLISMTPSEQLDFIKKITFEGEYHNLLKDDIKDKIKHLQIDIETERGRIEILTKKLQQEEDEKDQYDVQTNPDPENKFDDKYEGCKNLVETLQKKRGEVSNYDVSKLRGEVSFIQSKLDNLIILSDEDIDTLERDLAETYESYQNQLMFDQFLAESQEVQDVEDTISSLEEQILPNEELKNFRSSVQAFENVLSEINAILSGFNEKLNEDVTEEDIKILVKFIGVLKEKNVSKKYFYKCPTCKENLVLCGKVLTVKSSDDTEKEGECYDDIISILDDGYKTLKNYNSIYQIKDRLEKDYELRLELKTLNYSLNNGSKDRLQTLQTYFDEESIDETGDDVLERDLSEIKNQIEKAWKDKALASSLKIDLDEKKKKLESLETTENISELLEKSLIRLNQLEKIKVNIEKYRSFLRYSTKMKEVEKTLKDHQNKLLTMEERLKALLTLREKVSQAEVLSLENTIYSINDSADHFLELMFENPISVKVENFKKTKKDTKWKFNTVINYKGNAYTSISQLSGGERQKCELAYELAVNSLSDSKLLMFDECICYIDFEVNTEIVELLNNYAKEHDKLVVVVSHECVKGLFDKIISLD